MHDLSKPHEEQTGEHDEQNDKVASISLKRKPPPLSKHKTAMFALYGHIRQLALFAIAAMGLWPMLLQVILIPESVFGDGHGDRYEQLSYFAFENDHYQVLEPRKVSCTDLQHILFSGTTPTATTDLIRAVPYSTFELARSLVVNQTTGDGFIKLSVNTGILGLGTDSSVCFGGVDAEGAIQIEALMSANDVEAFGIDSSCVQGSATHMRLRLQSTEFFVPDTMGELNPSRTSGAMLIASSVDANLKPVLSSCFTATRTARYSVTKSATEYKRLVTVYSGLLLIPETCASFTLFGGERDEFGCAYSSIGTSGAVADINSDGSSRTYSYPAPWRMIQCTVTGDCSSLLFTQLWLSEWSVQAVDSGLVLRHNFVNHKVNEVTVDSTFSIRLLISLQILALVATAYLTSVRGWHTIRCSFVSPWATTPNAITSCTIAKVVRSSYNFILVAQMVLGVIQWRKQLTIDLLVGADTEQAVLRAVGCGTLIVALAINIVFARAGDLKMQEMEPSVAHVVGFLASLVLYLVSRKSAAARALLAKGMRSVSATEVTQHSGCRGSSVCAVEVSLTNYTVVLIVIIGISTFVGLSTHTTLQASVHINPKVGPGVNDAYASSTPTPNRQRKPSELTNSFTRFLDDRSRRTALYDCSTEVYVQAMDGSILSTRGQLEACGFVPAMTMLFRYRDLPLFLAARVLPLQVLNFFNLTVTVYEIMDTGRMVGGVPVVYVADQIIHAHWSKLKSARLSWMDELYGGEDVDHRFTSGISTKMSVRGLA